MNRALHVILAPTPAPAGVADCMDQWPTQEGFCSVILNQWQFGNDYPTLLLRFAIDAAPEVDDSSEQVRVQPRCSRWMPCLRAEPVARFVQTSTQPPVRLSNSVRVPAFHIPAKLTTTMRPPFAEWMASLPAEPVAFFVQPSSAGNLPCVAGAPAFSITAELTTQVPPSGKWMALPAAEPAARFVMPQVAPQIEASLACSAAAVQVPDLKLAAELPVVEKSAEPVAVPAPCEAWMPGLAAAPVARMMWPSIGEPFFTDVSVLLRGGHVGGLSHISLSHVKPAKATPALCEPCTAIPAAEPVARFVAQSVAPNVSAAANALLHLPALGQTRAKTQGLALAASARNSQPCPVESWLPIAVGAVGVIAMQPASRFRRLASPGLAACKLVPELAGPATGAPPMGVESLVMVSAAAVPDVSVPAAQMQPFALAAATEQTVSGFEKPCLSPARSAPKLPGNVVVLLRPISTISVTAPQPEIRQPATAMPQPGIMPVEYHPQRMRGTPVCGVEWQTSRIAPAPPRFVVRPVFDRVDEDVKRPKFTRKDPAFADVFKMPEARKHSDTLGYAARAIAAALVVGAMWFGVSMARLSRQSTVARQDVFSSSETAGAARSLSAAARPAGGTQGPAQAKGPVAWVRQAIASRAAYNGAENFSKGMQAWGSAPKSYAAGWERNRDGYVHPGGLAIFTPSRNFKDYRFEFFGQVEQKSMDWVVRAKDANNYYAMKFKVVEAGLRPIIAVVHYAVVDGKAGHRVETPLNVMVHNNEPFQVAVDVKGNHFSASIDGEEVDSWSDDVLPAGGVGFFAEAGERSRVYWMKISTNDDWLGSVCSMLAGSDAGRQVTSELWGAGSGNVPRGGIPSSRPHDSGDMTLAAAGLGLPFFPVKRTRRSKNRRYQPWSS